MASLGGASAEKLPTPTHIACTIDVQFHQQQFRSSSTSWTRSAGNVRLSCITCSAYRVATHTASSAPSLSSINRIYHALLPDSKACAGKCGSGVCNVPRVGLCTYTRSVAVLIGVDETRLAVRTALTWSWHGNTCGDACSASPASWTPRRGARRGCTYSTLNSMHYLTCCAVGCELLSAR